MYDLENTTPWQLFQKVEQDSSGLGHYIQAEVVAVFRAIEMLKTKPLDKKVTFHEWASDAIEFANGLPNIGAKYRDTIPLLMALQDYGLVKFDGEGDLETDWDKFTVRITAKGLLAQPNEYFTERTKEPAPNEWFNPARFDDTFFLEQLKADDDTFLEKIKSLI